jgi:hypothetical protein
LRDGVADQLQGRNPGKGGKPSQRQDGSEDTAGNDQDAAPKSARLRAE